MWLAQSHPTWSVEKVRGKVRAGFLANAALAPDTPEFKRALARGRWELKELEALIEIHKYRSMKSRYEWAQG